MSAPKKPHITAYTEKKPSLWQRMFGKKQKTDMSSYTHKPYALEPYHQELSAPADMPKKKQLPKKEVNIIPTKETGRQTLIKQEAVLPVSPMDAPTPVRITASTPAPKETIPKKQEELPKDSADSTGSIVSNIMKQSEAHGGRKVTEKNILDFKKPQQKDYKWLPNFLSYVLFFMTLAFIAGLGFFNIELNLENTFTQDVLGRPSVARVYEDKTIRIDELNREVSSKRRQITQMELRIQELAAGNLTYNTFPFLTQAKVINDARIDWQRALKGIDDTVAKAGGAREFLRRLTYQGFTFNNETKQITLGSPTVRGVYYEEPIGDVVGSSISEATRVLQIFEESSYFRDLKQLTFSRSSIDDADSEFGLHENSQTPIVLNMIYQEAGEKDCRDRDESSPSTLGNNCFSTALTPNTTTSSSSPETGLIQRQ